MKHLKYFESHTEVSLKQKLESIVDMCNYLWSIDAADSLRGFYGKCSALFTGCLEVNKGWSKGGKKPYEFDVDCLVNKLETSEYRREERLSTIEELYKLSKVKRFKYTKEDIERILKPVADFKILGNPPVEKIEISQFYDWLNKASFSVKFYINEEELSSDRVEIKKWYDDRDYDRNAKAKIGSVGKEFYHIKQVIKGIVEKIDLKSLGIEAESTGDYTHLGEFDYFGFHLKEI